MNGPDCFREAEKCLQQAQKAYRDNFNENYWVQRATVYATLALAAAEATALCANAREKQTLDTTTHNRYALIKEWEKILYANDEE